MGSFMWFNLIGHGTAQDFTVYTVSVELHENVRKLSGQRFISSEVVMQKNTLRLIKFR